MPDKKKITVLVVDDSAMVRKLLVDGLSADPELEVVGSAGDAYEARDIIVRKQPDVVTLDVEMPRMDGLEFLRRIMPRMPIRAVMVSALTRRGQEITLRALEMGAVDFVSKPSGGPEALGAAMAMLRQKVKVAALFSAFDCLSTVSRSLNVSKETSTGRQPRTSGPEKISEENRQLLAFLLGGFLMKTCRLAWGAGPRSNFLFTVFKRVFVFQLPRSCNPQNK